MKSIRIAATLLSLGLSVGTLPAQNPASSNAAEQDATMRDILRVPSGEPQLRIHINGHTGVVRAVAFTPDSARLCTAGLDKVVQVWNLRSAPRDLQGSPLQERTLRWQVARGLRGSIQAVACSPSDGLLAVGGYGAMGSLGEILLVDPVQGTLTRVLEGHLQPICSLAFAGDGNRLASMDTEGRTLLWKRGEWTSTVLYAPDEKTYGLEKARIIAQQPKLRPVAIVGGTHVVLPVYIDQEDDGRPIWKIQRIKLDDIGDVHTFDTVHHGVVAALAVAADGGRMASADIEGNLFLRDLRGGQVVSLKPGATVLSLAFSPDGRSLVVGTALAGGGGKAEMQVWDVSSHARLRRRPTDDHVHACAVSPDGKRIAYVGGSSYEVFVESLSGDDRQIVVGGVSRRILKVAFAKQEPYYRVAFGSRLRQRAFNDYGDLEQSFDTQRLELAHAPPNPADWIPADWGRGDWEAKWQRGGFLQLYRNKQPKGKAVFDTALEEGSPRAFCWIPDERGAPFAIAVGSDGQNSIYVFRLAEEGQCPILRHFRGHHDYVTSLGVSRDRKYLISGSADGTVGLWSLAGFDKGRPSRWGASLTVVLAGESLPVQGGARPQAPAPVDRLLVRDIPPAGPLYFKGVRLGDAIGQIRWFADREGRDLRSETRPERILAALDEMPWGTQVQFQVSRDGTAHAGFLLLPAWQPLASLFVSAGKEWAFWTPEGYYDASINGYTLFGWQVNRGLHSMPAFYRADQFRRKLEQPGVLERLLPAGSLQQAFQLARLQPRGELQNAVPEQIAIAPAVQILRPRSGLELAQNTARVAVKIDARADVKIVRAKVYANGVVAPQGKLVAQRAEGDRVAHTYEWEVPLPADETNLIQVIAGTDGNVTGLDEIQLRRTKPVRPARPRMHIRAVGINTYADPSIPPLSYSVADAQAVLDVLKARAGELYTVESASLLAGGDATPQQWRQCLQTLADQLKNSTGPDDLIVLFLAGHGWADPGSGEYYYIGHRFKLPDLGKSYSECISWNDFRILGEIPCRKLVLLDTCHSGAIQPLRARNGKAAVRQLQDDVIFTLAASKGEQEAAENRDWKHGVFTQCLLESLEGKGDMAGRRDVMLKDVVEYVQKVVPRITGELTKGAKTQQPTAAPDELMAYIRLPLTRATPPSTSANRPSSSSDVPSGPKP